MIALPAFLMIHILQPPQKEILRSYFLYYQILPQEQKQQFEIRLAHLLQVIRIEGGKGLSLTEEMRILVGAFGIMLSFGSDRYLPLQFVEWYLYPDAFFSPLAGDLALSEIHLGGKLFVSWKQTISAMSHPDRFINPVLFNWALAYYQEHYTAWDPVFSESPKLLLKWHQPAVLEQMFSLHSKHLLPSQLHTCAKNPQYFFALCADYYFQTPAALYKYFPDLFADLNSIFNQQLARAYGIV